MNSTKENLPATARGLQRGKNLKTMLLIAIGLLSQAALVQAEVPVFPIAEKSQAIVVADLFGDLRQQLENKAREVVKSSTAAESSPGNQISAEQPTSQYPAPVMPANSKAKKAGKAANEADASPLTNPMQNDGTPTVQAATSPTASRWQVLKLGQSGNGIVFKRVGNDAIAFLDKTPIEKCLSGSDYQSNRESLEYKLKWSRVVSAASHTGQYVAVFCTSGGDDREYLDEAYGVHLINLKTKTFFSPGPSKLFQLLQPWISFSPDDRYAVLNQSGDEGDYAPLVLDLNIRRAKILDAPLFPHEEGSQTTWLNDTTAKYRRSDACDDKSCNSVGTYDFEVNVSTMKVKRKRVGG